MCVCVLIFSPELDNVLIVQGKKDQKEVKKVKNRSQATVFQSKRKIKGIIENFSKLFL